MSSERPFEIVLPLIVKTYDIDFAGVVSNIVYIRWLEDLRLQLLEAYLPLEQQMAEGYGPILGTTHIEYKRPIRMFDQPVGRMWVERLGRTSWQVQAEFLVNEEIAAPQQPRPAHLWTIQRCALCRFHLGCGSCLRR